MDGWPDVTARFLGYGWSVLRVGDANDMERIAPRAWRRRIDTFLDSPHDIVAWRPAPVLSGRTYRAQARSVVVLFSEIATARAREASQATVA